MYLFDRLLLLGGTGLFDDFTLGKLCQLTLDPHWQLYSDCWLARVLVRGQLDQQEGIWITVTYREVCCRNGRAKTRAEMGLPTSDPRCDPR